MTMPGFQDAQTEYRAPQLASFAGQVRRFGPHGPAYEVVGMAGPSMAAIVVVETGEQLSYDIVDLIADPIAETVP